MQGVPTSRPAHAHEATPCTALLRDPHHAATDFRCAALNCVIAGARCATRWKAANVERRPDLRHTACGGCPFGQARAQALLGVSAIPPRRPPRRRSKGVGRGKGIPWDNLPEGLKLGAMSDEDLARRLSPHVPGGVTSAAVRSARYTRKIARYTPPRFPDILLVAPAADESALALVR